MVFKRARFGGRLFEIWTVYPEKCNFVNPESLKINVAYRQWYEAHYALPLARKKNTKLSEEDNAIINKKRSVCQNPYWLISWIFCKNTLKCIYTKNFRVLCKKMLILMICRSRKVQKKYTERQKTAQVDALLIEQFQAGRLLGKIESSKHEKC